MAGLPSNHGNIRSGRLASMDAAGSTYTDRMFDIYSTVMAGGLPNLMCAHISLPSNFDFEEWDKLIHSDSDRKTSFWLPSFPASQPVMLALFPFPFKQTMLRPLLIHITYSDREVSEGDMLGPFKQVLFSPWCQTNPLLTRPKKDSLDRRVIIMDLSWPLPPLHSISGGTPVMHFLGCPVKCVCLRRRICAASFAKQAEVVSSIP